MKDSKYKSERYDDIFFPDKDQAKSSSAEETSISVPEPATRTKTELLIGSVFAGRYQVLKELGKGGMGKVYEVWDSEINEQVAIKLLNPEIAGDQETLERFRNELKLARKISHRNVCRMFDLSKEEGTYYITMEFVPGEDLKSYIKRIGPLSPAKAISISKQVCQGLAEAHKLGVIHCDLKSQNIMIDGEGNVRIVDFGVARSLKSRGMTETGLMIGTPEYMSIEQVEGKKVDQRSDIYSLGIILYEMVTGKVPFKADTPLSTALRHTTQAPPDPRGIITEIPEELSSMILKCLEKDKEKRCNSAEELLKELCRIEKDMPSTQILPLKGISSAFGKVKAAFVNKRLFMPAFALMTMLLLGVLILQPLSQKEVVPIPKAKPSLAVLPFHTNSGNQSFDIWKTGIALLLATDLKQSEFIHVLGGQRISNILSEMNLVGSEKYSAEDLQKVAIQAGADHILIGSFFRTDDGLTIIAAVQNQPSGLVISSRRVTYKGEDEIFAAIDGLTEKIRLDLGLSKKQVSEDSDRHLEQVTTASHKAYEYYIQGWQNQIEGGDPGETIKLMESAIELDPEFAMAYRIMAKAYGELGLFSKMWDSLRKAYELKHRLSLRDYLLIQGELYSMSEETYDKAIESYEELLKSYPYDRDANLNLGLMFCYDLEQWDKAIERFDILILNREVSIEPYVAQAGAYMAKGIYNKGKEVLENYLTTFPDEILIHERISNLYLCQGNLDLALSEAGKALSENPSSVSPFLLGDIYHCSGDLTKAEKEYQKMLTNQSPTTEYHACFRLAALYLSQGKFGESKRMLEQMIALTDKIGDVEQKIWSLSYLAQVDLASGNPEDALQEWERAMNIASEENLDWPANLHLKGLIHLALRSQDKAQRTADELKQALKARKNKKLVRYYYNLMGRIELERQNFSEAIVYFKRAISLLPSQHSESDDHAIFIYPLAFALYSLGDLEEAQEQYKRIISLTTGRLFFGHLYAKSSHMLGRICQKKGQNQKAIEHYSRFIELWRDAAPGIPELEDAKKQLTKLRLKNKDLAETPG